jgi:hypothetical protein
MARMMLLHEEDVITTVIEDGPPIAGDAPRPAARGESVMSAIDHLSSGTGKTSERSRYMSTVKAPVRAMALWFAGAGMIPGAVLAALSVAAVMVKACILLTTAAGFAPYWWWLCRRLSRVARVRGEERQAPHELQGDHVRALPAAPVAASDDDHAPRAIRKSPAPPVRRKLVAGFMVAALLGSGAVATAQAGAVDCSRAVSRGAAQSDARTPYQYPFRNPYRATITIALLNTNGLTPGVERQVVHVPVLPGRNHLPSLEGRGVLSVALYSQSRPAPLLFIVPGIGSSAYFGLATYYASRFHREGFHVVILPSPMNWNFALAASRSGAPGYTPADARDLYNAMQKTVMLLRGRYGLTITGVDFMGVSLGALDGAFLSVIDAEQRKLGIERYLLVNPPVDLSYALRRLDEWAGLRDQLGEEGADLIRDRALAIVDRSTEDTRNDPSAIGRLADQFCGFTTEELQFLIGQYVQATLPELIYVTQALHDRHVLAAGRDEEEKRLEEARRFTLMDYTERIGLPSWAHAGGAPGDLASADRQGSLTAVVDQLRRNPKVYIMHNADDVLSDPAAIAKLKAVMGDRMILYLRGGHLGNLWYRANRQAILGLFGRGPKPIGRRYVASRRP